MQERRLDDAALAWDEVLKLAPEHPQALFHLGQHALYRKEPARARMLLERAAKADPRNPAIFMNLAFVCRGLGDAGGEFGHLTQALAIDPYFYPALLARGMLEERTGKLRKAARTFKDVLKIAPPEDQLTGEMKRAIERARSVVDGNAQSLDAFLRERLAPVEAKHPDAPMKRFAECRDIATGRAKEYRQEPTLLLVPQLPAIPFHDRALFPWLERLEAATPRIRDELLGVLSEGAGDMKPYIRYAPGAPLNQWAELNHSPRWNAYFLWEDSVRNEEHCRRCPKTAALLETLPMVDTPNYGPTALFSVLSPRTRIPAHVGVTNARLVLHLPLIVPPGCGFRVGNETREWREGEAWVFDDSIEHEAWNDGDLTRTILIIDVWNPLLGAAERELVSSLLNGLRDYYSEG